MFSILIKYIHKLLIFIPYIIMKICMLPEADRLSQLAAGGNLLHALPSPQR